MPQQTRHAKSHLFYQTRDRRPRLDRAEGIYMWDIQGKRYLDGSSGAMVSNIGHSNPQVLEAMREQMNKATFGYRLHFETESSETLAAKMAALSPPELERVFFVSGGSEAVESSVKLARQYAVNIGQESRWKIISRAPSYHGCTLGALSITSYTPLTKAFAPMMQSMPKIAAPRAYLDHLDIDDPTTGLHYANLLEQKILQEGSDTVLAFIVEPIGGASTGALVPPVGYLPRIREICDQYGVLLIHDEVMTGGGRTGKFFGAEHWQVEPDIITLSKGFGAGYAPLGAMIAHNRLVDVVLDNGGFAHGFTYAGNPLACSAGLAVLDVIENQNLISNADSMGGLLKSGLDDLMQKFDIICDVRGKGLLLAFELARDKHSLIPLPAEFSAFQRLVEIAYENGLIIYARRSRDGLEGDHFLVCPPMIVTAVQIDEILAVLDRSMQTLQSELQSFDKKG
jgi:adenosylmethionine-8-amino-7-oxononanoate aminotransferase